MTINQRPNAEAAYIAARVPFHDGLYVVGPFAARVSFASQQRRALSLVYTINEDLRRSGNRLGLEEKDVAVIGAGLAGLTCAVALAACRSNVWVFEKQGALMDEMKTASHRDVHPTINFWPLEPLEFTTVLPFFNWYSDDCSSVLSRIEKNWNELRTAKPRISGAIRDVGFSHTVTGFERRGSKWRLDVQETSDKRVAQREFDVLIFAVGFGAEQPPVGTLDIPGYWDFVGDRITSIKDRNANPCDNYVISGTGDGGAIEALRLLFKDFRAGSINAKIASIFSDANLGSLIQRIESSAQKMMLDFTLHNKDKDPVPDETKSPVPDKVKDAVSIYLWDNFRDVVLDRLNLAARQALEELRSAIPKVYLVGERAAPLELSTSPFHKLLIAYSVSVGRLEYFQLNKDASDKTKFQVEESTKSVPLGIKAKKVSFEFRRRIGTKADGTIGSEDKIDTRELDGSFFVGRHGYVSPIPGFPILKDAIGRIRRLQLLYADQDWISTEQAAWYSRELGLPGYVGDLVHWADSHQPMFNDFLQDRRYFPDDTFPDKLRAKVIPPLVREVNGVIVRSGPTQYHLYHSNDKRPDSAILSRVPDKFVGVEVNKMIGDTRIQPHGSGHPS